ncbi:MAG: tRNA 2-thiouridine(34) synthase MnmA [candidate division SR1 bacterium]|nr:tRNA 2-thiouridine(34) synthase MnmA [candidate division SR1 bacterium]
MNIESSHIKKTSTVYMMMSGGVDSSVAAAILKNEGYNVIGVFIKCWSIESLKQIGVSDDLYGCFWEEDSTDAQLVADSLDIPFYVWDFEEEYKKGVVDYMINEYKIGRTPNPDVMCNSTIKFGIFYEKAIQLGADFVATGHYARSQNGRLYRGKDQKKDQSYFVWRIRKDQLDHVLMPIGKFDTKAEVRALAEKYNLITAYKPDSQGLCFIGETPVRQLLLQTLGEKEGNILDVYGKILGKHSGAFQYTIGQRHQLGLAGGPWFVRSTDIEKNTVSVAHDTDQKSLYSNSLIANNINYFRDLIDGTEYVFAAQIRYRQDAQECIMTRNGDSITIDFKQQVRAVSKGQSVVIYDGDEMVAGGIIS